MPGGEHVLRSRSDFQRFCAGFRTTAHELDDLVEGLRALADSPLRSRDKGRFARSIARHLSESFHAAEVRAVASVPWPPEISMAIRRHVTAEGEPAPGGADGDADAGGDRSEPGVEGGSRPRSARVPRPGPERDLGPDPREISVDLGAPTVVFLGDEDEHRVSIERLRIMGFHCLRQGTTAALDEVFARETVVGLVVGSSFWAQPDPHGHGPRRRLERLLCSSNLCWTKLVRSAAWAPVQDQLPDLWDRLYFRAPPSDRVAVEDQPTISKLEMRCLTDAAEDILYAERCVEYEFQPSILQDRIIRAATSRYLRDRFPSLHRQEAPLRVRPLADRGQQGLVGLVSISGTDVSFVVKVSPYADAVEEARRFRMFASGSSFEMEFFCHATLGALVFAPVDARLGQARSLDDVLQACGLRPRSGDQPELPESPEAPCFDAALGALERFSRQVSPRSVTTFCDLESEQTPALLDACPRLWVAGEPVDLRALYQRGVEVLDRCSGGAVVHGDAHPGNILFTATGSAILIDYECAGLGPPCCDPCTLWIFAFGSRFLAVGDERATVGLVTDLLRGAPLETLVRTWAELLGFSVNHQVVYLTRRALDASHAAMRARGFGRGDVLGVVAVLLCRELFNPRLQQHVIRCALAATQAVWRPG